MSNCANDGQSAGGGSSSGGSAPASTKQTTLSGFVSQGDGEVSEGPRNRIAAKLNFPTSVPADVKDAVLRYAPSQALMIADIPNVKGKPSFTAFYGVRLEYKPEDGKKLEPVRKQVYACLASQGCRTTAKTLKISSSSTTGATNHLKQEHSITSETSAAQQQKKQAAVDSVQQVKHSQLYQSDPTRWNALSLVKSFIIRHAFPFSLFDDKYTRHTLAVLAPADKLQVQKLNNKANALLERFKDPALLHEVQDMDYAEEQHSDEDDDTVDPAWVAADPQYRGSGHEGGDSLGDVP